MRFLIMLREGIEAPLIVGIVASYLQRGRGDGGFETCSKLSERNRKLLAGRVNTLAEDLSKLRGMLGLN